MLVDVLELNGRDLRAQCWDARRAMLKQLRCLDGIRLSEHIADTDGATEFRQACAKQKTESKQATPDRTMGPSCSGGHTGHFAPGARSWPMLVPDTTSFAARSRSFWASTSPVRAVFPLRFKRPEMAAQRVAWRGGEGRLRPSYAWSIRQ
jgi:hypothetical protein